MKKILTLFILTLVPFGLLGGVIEKTLHFSGSTLSFNKLGDYDLVIFEDGAFTGSIGEPMLPVKFYRVLIPPDAVVERIEIVSREKTVLPGSYKIYPVQPPVPISKPNISFREPVKKIYSSSELYPSNLGACTHLGTKSGYRIVGIRINPVQYIPSEEKLILHTTIELKVWYEQGKYPIKHKTVKQIEIFGKCVENLVMNVKDIRRWSPPIKTDSRGSRVLPAGNYEYVVISPQADTSYFSPLTYWKIKKGVPARMVTTEYIYANYGGANNQEEIKNFIDDANTTWGTVWFVLGGDVGWVPYRGCYGYVQSSPPTEDYGIPCERYYEDLDNNWNYTVDTRYGYTNDGPGGGDIDMYADVYVGRISVDNSTEAQRVVDNILQYEKNPPSGYLKKIVYFSEYLFGSKNGKDICEDLIVPKIPGGWTQTKRYNENGWYASDDQAVGDMNAGYGFNMVASHGDADEVMQGQASAKDITVSDLASLLQLGDKRGIHTGICCISGGFDYTTCYAEQLLNDVDSKITACIFNSRYGWGTTSAPPVYAGSAELCEDLFNKWFNENIYNLGQALAETRDNYVSQAGSYSGWDGVYRWCIFEYNLIGDPEMPVWTDEPSPLIVTHDATVSGPVSFSVSVSDESKAPVSNALVCLWCKLENTMWERGYTDASGNVSILVNPTMDSDTMWVTVTKHNYIPYEGYATVTEVSINLTEFSANAFIGNVKINWRTESESDNVCWIIERAYSEDINWEQIGTVPGQGMKPSPTEYLFIDAGIERDGKYFYRLISVDSDGEKLTFGPVSEMVQGNVPCVTILHDILPNPCAGKLSVFYDIPKRSYVRLLVYNSVGQVVRTIVNRKVEHGYHSVTWDGKNDRGVEVGNGIYFLRMNAENFIAIKKILLVK